MKGHAFGPWSQGAMTRARSAVLSQSGRAPFRAPETLAPLDPWQLCVDTRRLVNQLLSSGVWRGPALALCRLARRRLAGDMRTSQLSVDPGPATRSNQGQVRLLDDGYAAISKNGFLSSTAARTFVRSIAKRSRSFIRSITNSRSEASTMVLFAECVWHSAIQVLA